MLKSTKMLLLSFSLLLILAACGQGSEPADEEHQEDPEVAVSNGDTVTDSDSGSEVEPPGEETTEPKKDEVLIKEVTLYFSDNDLMNIYRTKKEIKISSEETAAKETLQVWVDGPDKEELTNLLPDGVVVQSVEAVDGIAHVSFSSELLNANLGSTGELFLLEQVAMTMEQFGFTETLLLIDGEIIPEFLGHIDTSEPIKAGDPEQYELK